LQALRPGRSHADPLGIPVGLQLYTVYPELEKDFEGTLQKIAEIGIRDVELLHFPRRNPSAVQRAIRDAGLRAHSIHLGGDPLLLEPQQQIDLAAELGVSYLICPTMLTSPAARLRPEFSAAGESEKARDRFVSTITLDDWRWNAETFNHLGERALRSGIQFGYHNHSLEFRRLGGTVVYDELIRLTDPKYVTFEMDCGWVENSAMSAAEYLGRYPGRFQLLHIKDIRRRATPGQENNMASVEVGHGVIDWRTIFGRAPAAGVKHYFIEQEAPFERPRLESVRLSYQWLHQQT
jgi:sugar phosphate isomerase/epimerase